MPDEGLVYYDDYLDLTTFPKATAKNWKDLGDAIFLPTEIKDDQGTVLYRIYPLLGSDAVHGN